MSLLSRIVNVLRGHRVCREIEEELGSHLQEAVEHGRDPAEARKAFGSALQRREESLDIRLIPWLDSILARSAAIGNTRACRVHTHVNASCSGHPGCLEET